PLGVVQIMDPPAPPALEGLEMDLDEAAREQHTERQAEEQLAEASADVAADKTEGPLQLSLFEVPEPSAEVVHKLRLPAAGQSGPVETPLLFMDKEDAQKTSTMIVNTSEMLR